MLKSTNSSKYAAIFLLSVAFSSVAIADSQTDRVDKLFSRWAKPDSPGCALAVIQHGEIIYKAGYGMSNLEYDIPVKPTSIFQIASISKQFTAFSILLLEKEGKLSLDDDIRKFIPEMHDFDHKITIRHLLHHTSGLRDQGELLHFAGWRPDDVITKEHLLKLLYRQRELNFSVGEKYMYSNSGFTLLAEIVSRISGQPFDEFCKQRIFDPLEMTRTHFHADHEMIVKDRTYSYAALGGGKFKNLRLNYACAGPSNLFTTVEDFAKWDRNFNDAKIGGQSVISKMHVKGILNDGKEIARARGLNTGSYKGIKTVGHNGAHAGYRGAYLRFPDHQFAVVIFSNISNFYSDLAKRIADIYLADHLNQDEKKPEAGKIESKEPKEPQSTIPIKADPEILDRYAGHYRDSDGRVAIVIRDGDRLRAKVLGLEERFELTSLSDTKFHVKKTNIVLTFVEDDREELNIVKLKEGANTLSLKRIAPFQWDKKKISDYVGIYYSAELQTFYTVAAGSDEDLVLQHQRIPDATMTPKDLDEFVLTFPTEIVFTRDAAGRVSGFKMGSIQTPRFDKVTIQPTGSQ